MKTKIDCIVFRLQVPNGESEVCPEPTATEPGGYPTNLGGSMVKETFFSHQLEWVSSEKLPTTDAGEGVEKREPSCTVGGNVN